MFEATNISSQTLGRILIKLLDKYGLRKKIIVYVKNEGSNLNAMKAIVNCQPFGLEKSFQGTCFGHVFSKACQYGTAWEKVCRDLKYVSIKFVQAYIQKCITWPKKSGKERLLWNKACVKTIIHPKNLNTLVKTRQSFLFHYDFNNL